MYYAPKRICITPITCQPPAKSDTHLYLQCTKHRSQLIHLNKVLLNNKTRVGQNHCLGRGTNRLGAKGKPLMQGKTIWCVQKHFAGNLKCSVELNVEGASQNQRAICMSSRFKMLKIMNLWQTCRVLKDLGLHTFCRAFTWTIILQPVCVN